MLRVVLAVAMASALLAVSTPAVESARVQHSDERVSGEIERIERTAAQVAARNDPPPPNTDGARRKLTVRLPENTFGTAGLDTLRIPATTTQTESVTVRWRVDGGTKQVRHVTAAKLDTEGTLTLREGGRHRLCLVLQPDGSVRIERADLSRETRPDPP